ncbi:MAG: FkbM family methyltransferase [Patescibacteria group bacterium]
MSFFFSLFKGGTKALRGYNLGALPGIRALHAKLYGALRPRGFVEVPVFGRKMIIDAEDKGGAHEYLINNNFNPYETEVFRNVIKPGMSVIDVGAHIGYFSILAADGAGPTGRIYAFEPEPKNFELLKRNIALNNLTNVVCEQKALAERSGSDALYRDEQNLGNMSFAAANIPESHRGAVLTVSSVTLDEYCKDIPVDFIKMDVQGAEGKVLEGGLETARKAKVMLIEFWPYGLRNLGTDPRTFLDTIAGMGYTLYLLNESTHAMKPISPERLLGISANRPDGKGWANILCVREVA